MHNLKICCIFAISIKTKTDMTREFTTHLNETYKVSVNFRTQTIRVWKKYNNQWCRHLKSCRLFKTECNEIAFDMTGNDFKQFLQTDSFVQWR